MPQKTATVERRSGRHPFVVALGLGLAALAVLISRRPDQWFTPQFWGEDGVIFFADAAKHGGASWWQPYAGYLHLVPRTVALLSVSVPWEFQPNVFMLVAALLTAAIVVRVACSGLPSPARWLAATAVLAVPHSGEVFLNVTNLHWILAVLLALNLLEPPPATRVATGRRTLEIAIAGLSGPMIIFFTPFVLLWLWRGRRERFAWGLGIAWAVVATIQVIVVSTQSREPTTTLFAVLQAAPGMLPRYAAAIFVGEWLPYTLPLGVVVGVIAGVAVVSLLIERPNPQRGAAALLLGVAALLLVVGRLATAWWGNPFGGAARYTYVPLVLILWAFALLAAGATRRARRILALALFAAVVVSATSRWVARPLPELNWPRQVREAREGSRREFEVPPGLSFPVPR
jgi:hypothetical protein